MSWFSNWTGADARRNQGKAEKETNLGYDRMMEMWQKYLGDLANTAVGQEKSFAKTTGKLQGIADSMLSGDMEGVPDYLRAPSTSGDEWDQLMGQLDTLSALDLDKAMQGEASSLAEYNNSRGIPTSEGQATKLPGFQRFYATAKAESSAKKALQAVELGERFRSEGKSNLYDVLGQTRAGQLDLGSLLSPAFGIEGARAGASSEKAAYYRNQAGNSSPLGDIMSLGGYYLGGGFRKAKKPEY